MLKFSLILPIIMQLKLMMEPSLKSPHRQNPGTLLPALTWGIFTPVLFGLIESNSSSFPLLERIFWAGVNAAIVLGCAPNNRTLRVYSHQESPLVHLLWSGPNTMLMFCIVWCGLLSHCPFCKWTRNGTKKTKKNTHVLRSSIHWFIGSSIQPHQSSFGSGPKPPLQLCLGTVVWCAPECDCCTNQFGSIEPNKTNVNTPLLW